MLNSVIVLYVAVLISTHQSALDTFNSVFVLLLHDFVQHAIISSHRWRCVVSDSLKDRMVLSASIGVQLLLFNTMIAYVAFFAPLIYIFLQVSLEWGVPVHRFEHGASLVLQSIRKIYQNEVLQGSETLVAFSSVVPASLVNIGAYWLSATTYGSMSFRRALHGSRLENLCLDDVMVNGLVSSVSVLTGLRMVKILESLVLRKFFEGAMDMYRDGFVGRRHHHRNAVNEMLLKLWMSVFDVATSVCGQGLICAAVAKRDIFGRKCERNRTLIKLWVFETVFGALRVGVLVDWENWVVSLGIVLSATFVVSVVANYAWHKYRWLKKIELKRERALCR